MTSVSVIRVLIVDDHRMVAEGIALALRRHPDIEVAGIAAGAREGIEATLALRPDVVLMDFHLADISGAAATAEIRAALPETAVVMISGDMSELAMLAALEAGASGYILKTEGSDQIAQQVRRAAAGEMLVPPGTLQRLVRLGRQQSQSEKSQALATLTAREQEVLALMMKGLDNIAIAESLVISYNTVRGHVQSILDKLGARTRLEAVARARAEGFRDS